MSRVFIGIGSNIAPEASIKAAIRLLATQARLLDISTFYRTPAEDRPEQPDYINGVVAIETSLPPEALKHGVLRRIEHRLGRHRSEDKLAPRAIDLDILLYDSLQAQTADLRLPARDVETRGFVAIPQAKEFFAKLRARLGKPPLPPSVILTASGNINLDEATFHTPGLATVVVTTNEGALRLARAHGDRLGAVAVRSTGESGSTTPAAVLRILADEFRVRLLLHEGGPTVCGVFLAAEMIDELFLTLAPQIAGRGIEAQRLGLAEHALFLPETAPWFSLQSVKKASDHLLLRYVLARK